MAGGDRTNDHGTMADRLQQTRAQLHGSIDGLRQPPGPDPMAVTTPLPPPDPRAGETATYVTTEAQHVLVHTTHGRLPGILVEWRRHADGQWYGYAVHSTKVEGQWVLVHRWVPARHLEPVKH